MTEQTTPISEGSNKTATLRYGTLEVTVTVTQAIKILDEVRRQLFVDKDEKNSAITIVDVNKVTHVILPMEGAPVSYTYDRTAS